MNKIGTIVKIKDEEIMEIYNFIQEMRSTNSRLAKKNIIESYKDNELLQDVIKYTYNPHMKYKIRKFTGECHFEPRPSHNNIFSLLDVLANSNINDALRTEVEDFLAVQSNDKIREVYKLMIVKDLKIGFSQFETIWPGIIPKPQGLDFNFGVQLASKLTNKKKNLKEPGWVTEKLDGLRCLSLVIDDSLPLLKSRAGKSFEGLVEIEEAIKKVFEKEQIVLDGELLATDVSPAEVFKESTKRIKNKNKTKTGVKYCIFDILDLEEYKAETKTTPYSARRERLDNLKETIKEMKLDHILEIVDTLLYTDNIEEIVELHTKIVAEGKEGLMINFDNVYVVGRTDSLLKVKLMNTVDLRIIGYQEGNGKYVNSLGALYVDYKGHTVNVGSGLNDAWRKEFWENQEKYLGRVVEIQYFEETSNAYGGISLRFPVFKRLREEGKEVSYH